MQCKSSRAKSTMKATIFLITILLVTAQVCPSILFYRHLPSTFRFWHLNQTKEVDHHIGRTLPVKIRTKGVNVAGILNFLCPYVTWAYPVLTYLDSLDPFFASIIK